MTVPEVEIQRSRIVRLGDTIVIQWLGIDHEILSTQAYSIPDALVIAEKVKELAERVAA